MLIEWARDKDANVWGCLREAINTLWAIGCAVVVTSLWRWNIDAVHPQFLSPRTVEGVIAGTRKGIEEAYRRFLVGLFPLNGASYAQLVVTDMVVRNVEQNGERKNMNIVHDGVPRVCFFDGGSRGNPGPGGSGSVIVEYDEESGRTATVWVAATALRQASTTNNVAEFVGLHRALARVLEKNWTKVHVVGNSAMIIGMLKWRKPPTSRKMQHWFCVVSRLADLCEVVPWTHHCRKYNKTADWLANYAMDDRRSVAFTAENSSAVSSMMGEVENRMVEDIGHWIGGVAAR
ncbi:hypothetical protein V7S43_012927 [Phytophthora oleae]|uniref:RNase H type-1 domain-containing protein n=1 Tax=Phytophthora oleae TaxID=2107226 RepID=A0ABD3F8W8_9STRA